MLASVAQLHKNHIEATYLFRLVLAEYETGGEANGEANGELPSSPVAAGSGGSSALATGGGSSSANGHATDLSDIDGGEASSSNGGDASGAKKELGHVERAELYNSLGESLIEVGCGAAKANLQTRSLARHSSPTSVSRHRSPAISHHR